MCKLDYLSNQNDMIKSSSIYNHDSIWILVLFNVLFDLHKGKKQQKLVKMTITHDL